MLAIKDPVPLGNITAFTSVALLFGVNIVDCWTAASSLSVQYSNPAALGKVTFALLISIVV
jgi:hypothetical protein